jgi:hypothetical protein
MNVRADGTHDTGGEGQSEPGEAGDCHGDQVASPRCSRSTTVYGSCAYQAKLLRDRDRIGNDCREPEDGSETSGD